MSPADVAHRPRIVPPCTDQVARRTRLRAFLVTVALVVLCYAYWRFMLRWFFPQRDDFWLVSITDNPQGRFSAGEFLWTWGHDWAVRNGRSADALVRGLLRPGAPLVGWIAPALLTACFTAAWRWLPHGMTWTMRVGAMLLLLTVVPVGLITAPAASGNTVFWAAGIGNYVVPTGMAMLATSWWVRPPRSLGPTAVAVLSMLVAGALHELAGVTVFVVTQVWWILNRRSVSRRDTLLIVTSYVTLAVALAGPGRWRRLDTLASEETGLARWLTSSARFTAELLLQTGPVWAALFVGLAIAVVASWSSSTVLERRWRAASTAVTGLAGAATWMLARSWRSPGDRCSQVPPLADGNATASVLMLVTAFVTVVAAAALLLRLRTSLGDTPVLLGMAVLATLPLPMATGLCAPRVWYPPVVWALTLLGVVITTLVARRQGSPRLLLVVAALGVVLSGRFAMVAEPALRANHDSFVSVLDQIPGTVTTGTGTVSFPEEVPHPDFGKAPVYRLPSIACGFRTYYSVPDAVVLDNGHAPQAGLPEYCPRPDAPRRNGR